MSNNLIQIALEKQRDDLFDYLSSQTISGLFNQEYLQTIDGSTLILGGIDENYISELKNYSKDTSFDQAFKEKVKSLKQLDNTAIINNFQIDIEKLIQFIIGNKFENELQAVFIEYDDYSQCTGIINGYGRQNYPFVDVPRYISSEFDFSKILFEGFDGINFQKAWVDCEEFEWTTEHLDIYYKLQELFQLHSRVLLNMALANLNTNGHLNILTINPLTFYINEHDSEVMTLYQR